MAKDPEPVPTLKQIGEWQQKAVELNQVLWAMRQPAQDCGPFEGYGVAEVTERSPIRLYYPSVFVQLVSRRPCALDVLISSKHYTVEQVEIHFSADSLSSDELSTYMAGQNFDVVHRSELQSDGDEVVWLSDCDDPNGEDLYWLLRRQGMEVSLHSNGGLLFIDSIRYSARVKDRGYMRPCTQVPQPRH